MSVNHSSHFSSSHKTNSVTNCSPLVKGGLANCEIHVNPNFAQSVHFNPKFFSLQNKNPAPSLIPKKLVEGKSLSKFSWQRKESNPRNMVQSTSEPVASGSSNPFLGNIHNGTSYLGNKKFIRKQPLMPTSNENITKTTRDNYSSKFENIKTPTVFIPNTPCQLKATRILSNNKRKLVCKEQLVKPPTTVTSSFQNKYAVNNALRCKSTGLSRTKFKIDKRQPSSSKRSSLKWKLSISRSQFKIENLFPRTLYSINKYSIRRSPMRMKLASQKASPCVSKKAKFGNMKVTNIGGILYRVSSHNLTRASGDAATSSKSQPIKRHTAKGGKMQADGQIITVRGERFALSRNGATLRRIPGKSSTPRTQQRVDFGGVTFKQKTDNVWVRTDSHRARFLLLQAKQRSIAILASRRRMIKTPCMIYNQFGKCLRLQRGLCPYIHDAKNVTLCPRFLQGKCTNSKCLLSHNISHQKVATCRYFLEGICIRENCPYLHVKVSQKAAVCQAFLEGFCESGQQCTKRHIKVCPEFEISGKCTKGKKCPYPHKKTIEKRKFKKSNTTTVKSAAKKVTYKNKTKKSQDKALGKDPLEVQTNRYYNAEPTVTSSSQKPDIVPERMQLDKLPSYIGLSKS